MGFTCAPLRRLPLGSALLEDLVQSLLLRHSAAAPPAAPSTAPSESDGSGAGRQHSYTEQALAAPVGPFRILACCCAQCIILWPFECRVSL